MSVTEWDTDQELQMAIALSRLLHPTSISFRNAARILYNDDGTVKHAVPPDMLGVDPDAWLAQKDTNRDWLIKGELEELKKLLQAKSSTALPARLNRALWYHEYASRTYYGHLRWILVCTAVESLLNTGKDDCSRQFRERLHELANFVGLGIDKEEAKTAYATRSQLAHGGATSKLNDAEEHLYLKLESILAAALKRSITDVNFAKIFKDEGSIRSQWPIMQKKKGCLLST